MNNNIQKTKKDLTIMFSIIVFIVITVLWSVFFSAKYFREISLETKDFKELVNEIDKWRLNIEEVMNFWTKLDKELLNNRKSIRNDLKKIGEGFKPKWFINYILLNNESSIISSNIKDDIWENFILEINKNNDFFKIKQSDSFIVKKILLDKDKWTFIIFKEIRYSFSNYLTDLLWFLFINLLFTLILYFIGFKFVNKAFLPVEENMNDMKDFIHNAWHELKTPISVIDSNIQLMDDLKTYDASMTKELKKEVLRLNSIIEGLIKLSNIDLLKDIQSNDLKDSIKDIIKEFKFKISEKNIKVKISWLDDIKIKANKNYFYIFLSNIIWNAIKYNDDKWRIDISYENWKLTIKDSWIWIWKKDLDKIFDRFFKWDKSRNSEGFWIGLSLVKKIADIYRWNIEVKSVEMSWSSFVIKF